MLATITPGMARIPTARAKTSTLAETIFERVVTRERDLKDCLVEVTTTRGEREVIGTTDTAVREVATTTEDGIEEATEGDGVGAGGGIPTPASKTPLRRPMDGMWKGS